ncbi:MAG: ribonuclease J [Proteobacteria bacterium]|nr:ribonuclease J [Pseudomonadota bacterium]
MTFNIKNYKDDLLFIPLGGADEIGMNLNLYHYKGKWLLIDLGIGFADQQYPGVDIIVPDIAFLAKHKQDIVGLVLTHAHEDHLGAVQYLWHELECPVYTTAFTAAVLKAKLNEMGKKDQVPITEIKSDTRLSIGPFDLQAVGITHSIPEMHAIAIRTDMGVVFHTGDWKFDHDPIIGAKTDEELLRSIGDEGVLAVVGDSTNIFSPGVSGSEGDLQGSLEDIIKDLKKRMVVVSTFASNIARLHSIAKAAQNAGRKVALAGRSLWRIYDAALSTGYLQDLDPFIREQQIKKYRRDEILVICTGCQGEPLAAASKLANNSHQHFALQRNDVMIFSSKIIPGNEKKIFALFNKLARKGVDIMTERDHFVHVSGHPSRDEVAKMYELLRPRISIPVHGEAAHLHEHAKFARTFGAQAIEPYNGIVIRIGDEGAEKIGEVQSGYLAIDGYTILESNSPLIAARRRMMHGALIITLIVNKQNVLVKPSLSTPGILDPRADKELLDELTAMIEGACGEQVVNSETERRAHSMVRKFISNELGKEPHILVQIAKV